MKDLSNTNAKMITSALESENVGTMDYVKENILKIGSIAILQEKSVQNAHQIGNAMEIYVVILLKKFVLTCWPDHQKMRSILDIRIRRTVPALAIQKTTITQFEIGIAMGRELVQLKAARESWLIRRMQLTIVKNFNQIIAHNECFRKKIITVMGIECASIQSAQELPDHPKMPTTSTMRLPQECDAQLKKCPEIMPSKITSALD